MNRQDFIPLATILLLAPRPLEENEHAATQQVQRAKRMAERLAAELGIDGEKSAAARAKDANELQAAMAKLAEVEHAKLAQGRELADALAQVKRLEEEVATLRGDQPSGLHDDDEGGENRPRRVDAPPAKEAPAGKGAPTSKAAR